MLLGIDASRANREQRTGVESYSYYIIEYLKKIIPQNIKVVLYSDKELTGDLSYLPRNWSSKILRWPPKRLWTQARLSFEMLTNPPDILFIPAHVFPLIHPKKTVMMVHDVAAYRFPQAYNFFENWYSLWSARTAVKKLWRVLTPSQFTKKEILNMLGLNHECSMANKIFAVHHGYDENLFRKIYDTQHMYDVLNKYGLKRPYVLSVGRFEEKKNTKNIINAFNLLSESFEFANLKLVLIGKPGYGYGDVQEIIRQSDKKKIIILGGSGWVDRADLPYILNSAEVFVFPSIYEGFGLPVLEAMACGVPVLASKGGAEAEIGGVCAKYVNPSNINEIAESMRELLLNKELRNNLIQKGFENVKNYSWKNSAEQTAKIFFENNV
jgi:glycosyltransferase involved in cell wall biosynthesis